MDSTTTKRTFYYVLLRCSVVLLFFFFTVLSLSYAVGFIGFLLGSFSISPPISFPSQCKIVSSSVDLRSSKVCELGLLNYKAKHVFYPSERKKFRCHYDYYWASVFKVEYKDHFSGQMLLGLVEAPKEALPHDCRPNFATAWLSKHKLKVNETYDCWYTSGRSKVEIFQDGFFGCQANEPSAVEMMRRCFILSMKLLQSWLSREQISTLIGWEMVAGAVTGFFASAISIGLFKICQAFTFWLPRVGAQTMITLLRRLALSRAFFLLAYFSLVSWLVIEYGKRLGLVEIFLEH